MRPSRLAHATRDIAPANMKPASHLSGTERAAIVGAAEKLVA
jgi:hypothetical protein